MTATGAQLGSQPMRSIVLLPAIFHCSSGIHRERRGHRSARLHRNRPVCPLRFAALGETVPMPAKQELAKTPEGKPLDK
jgi:hypothetical protein